MQKKPAEETNYGLNFLSKLDPDIQESPDLETLKNVRFSHDEFPSRRNSDGLNLYSNSEEKGKGIGIFEIYREGSVTDQKTNKDEFFITSTVMENQLKENEKVEEMADKIEEIVDKVAVITNEVTDSNENHESKAEKVEVEQPSNQLNLEHEKEENNKVDDVKLKEEPQLEENLNEKSQNYEGENFDEGNSDKELNEEVDNEPIE